MPKNLLCLTARKGRAVGEFLTQTLGAGTAPRQRAIPAQERVLTGTPDDSDVGTFNGIEIAATDGEAVTALPSFNVTVSSATATGSVSLAWTPPTQNEDGSTLTDLSGYKIHYGTTSKTYTQSIPVNTAGPTAIPTSPAAACAPGCTGASWRRPSGGPARPRATNSPAPRPRRSRSRTWSA